MRITSIKAYPVRIPRNFDDAVGTAGTPVTISDTKRGASFQYGWAGHYRTLYSKNLETTLVRIETDAGVIGWGEAQSPVAPEITSTIINTLLGPILIDEDALAPEALWQRMYSAMRVRGHTGSFLLDAIAGLDIAIWDICGKVYRQPIYRLLGGPCQKRLRCYVSGLAGRNNSEKISYARQHFEKGARAFKLFFDGTDAELLALVDDLRDAFGNEIDIFVDALWRLSPKTALELARSLESRKVGWLEAPLMPEDIRGHKWLALRAGIPIALGESYRTRFELAPFLENRAVDILQPDIGRIGITEGRKIACLADTFHVPVAPHISIGLGPQIAAALHFAHAVPNLMIVECNPMVFELANRVLREPLMFSLDQMAAPSSHGLGTELNDEALREFCT